MIRRFNFKYAYIIIMMALLTVLVACGCNSNKVATYNDIKDSLFNTQLTAISTGVEQNLTKEDNTSCVTMEKLSAIKDAIRNDFNGTNAEAVIANAIEAARSELEENSKNPDEIKTTVYNLQLRAVIDVAESKLSSFYNEDKLKRHQKELCQKEFDKTFALLEAATLASTEVDTKEVVEDTGNVYQIMSNYNANITTARTQQSPIRVYSFKEDGFFPALFNDVLVFPIGWLLYSISRLFGGYYIFGLFFVTIILRTIMMPVYNSTNDMQLKQQLMQPELQKLEAKYQNRQDPDSQKAKQMEQMQLYRKYKVGLGGCLPMLFQFPIFISIFQAVQRMHLTDGTVLNSPEWVQHLNTKVFGIDLFLNRGPAWKWQFWGVMIILVLVVGTQVAQQILTKVIQKATYRNSQADIPEYKRQAMQQDQAGNSMKFMMYFMIVMMAVFVFQSAAGLGVYWLIGNIFSLVQMYVNYKLADRKLARLKKKLKL